MSESSLLPNSVSSLQSTVYKLSRPMSGPSRQQTTNSQSSRSAHIRGPRVTSAPGQRRRSTTQLSKVEARTRNGSDENLQGEDVTINSEIDDRSTIITPFVQPDIEPLYTEQARPSPSVSGIITPMFEADPRRVRFVEPKVSL